ncbi:DUF4376 domain-containing protein [Rhizobium sp. DKSPLA3]|uniref:DUF4376 domain-containing protein n=1 Tax=Rhizobium quercicola TaxID=2901226 RepID=A0A9X1NR76_9HYPH|nr:DUF4376 domain-containing protein [Rhizobium quercicola]MCD7109697.1 DUF4376 domain-containing protein [Rhizobium quercicola]
MAIFVILADEFPAGFYDEELHGKRGSDGSTIPAAAVQITEDQHAELISNPGRRKLINGQIQPFEPVVMLTSVDIDAERDRRIAAGFTFGGNLYQAREQDLRNINGAATGAALALMQGAEPGDLRWQGGDSDFGWIAADNTIVPMDVVDMIGFGRAAMSHVGRLTMVGRSLKDRLADGETLDISDDALWGV